MLKDPRKFVRRLIIIIGVLNLISAVVSVGSFQLLPGLALAILLISVVFSVATIVVGLKFNTWTMTKTKWLTIFFWVYLVWTIGNTYNTFRVGMVNWGSILFTLLFAVITVYIIRKIKEFSVPEQAQVMS